MKIGVSSHFLEIVPAIDLILHILKVLNGSRDLAIVSLMYHIISIIYAKIVNIITFSLVTF